MSRSRRGTVLRGDYLNLRQRAAHYAFLVGAWCVLGAAYIATADAIMPDALTRAVGR